MPFKQNRNNRKNPPGITSRDEMEYKRLQEWRKQQLQKQRQRQQENPRFPAAEHQPGNAKQETRAKQMISRECLVDPPIQQNSQAEILQTLQAFTEQHEHQFTMLKDMVFQIQRQVLRLQKSDRVQRTSYTPYPPIVIKKENPESSTEDS